MKHKHSKGKIKHNAYAALVTSDLYLPKKEKPKKGKGSFKRKAKHKNEGYPVNDIRKSVINRVSFCI